MGMIGCQFSLYPLRTQEINEILEEALEAIDAPGLTCETRAMSSELRGSEEQVFAALQAAFRIAATHGDIVLVATVSNAC
jgi:uncharacterized protein YqgV (UPF0045/DUF77 family)